MIFYRPVFIHMTEEARFIQPKEWEMWIKSQESLPCFKRSIVFQPSGLKGGR